MDKAPAKEADKEADKGADKDKDKKTLVYREPSVGKWTDERPQAGAEHSRAPCS